jgi:hypothetical protein
MIRRKPRHNHLPKYVQFKKAKDKRQMNGAFRLGSKSSFYSLINIKWELNKMIRYTLFVLATLGTAATAIASIAPVDHSNPNNVTVVYKTQLPTIDGVVVQHCAVENCSDTPNNS